MNKKLSLLLLLVSFSSFAQLAYESFEGTWPTAGWTVTSVNGTQTWSQTDPNVPGYGGYASMKAAFIYGENVSEAEDWLISPQFTVPGHGKVKFMSKMRENNDQGGHIRLMIGTNPADLNTFTQLEDWTELEINPQQTTYRQIIVNIPENLMGMQRHIAFVMEGDADGADTWFIDGVQVTPGCEKPLGLWSQGVQGEAITFNWEAYTQFNEIIVMPQGVQPSGNGIAVTGFNFTFTNLLPGSYSVYVRTHCEGGLISDWTGPYNFTVSPGVVTGMIRFDANNDAACNNQDPALPLTEIEVTLDGTSMGSVYSNALGQYSVYNIPAGNHTVTLQPVPPAAFGAVPPVTHTFTVAATGTVATVDVCLPQPTQIIPDAEITIASYLLPRPGFTAAYSVTVKNKGAAALNGVIATVNFDDARLDLSLAPAPITQTPGQLEIPVGTLAPFESITYYITFNVLQPPVNMGGELLNFSGTVTFTGTDADMADNTYVLQQVIVNSFDPNDITVHEGEFITEEQADGELTYTIRFENTGTADAINIRLVNVLDDNLDRETFRPVAASHNFTASRNGNTVTFRFNNINLPAPSFNPLANRGYITYKIKPKATFAEGEIISNTADIFFDFNPAITTNTVTTQIQMLGSNKFAAGIVAVHPNPVKEVLTIDVELGELSFAEVFDVNGRKCNVKLQGNTIDIQQLQAGMYLLQITTTQGNAQYKIIKQ